jgi:hypothetical protein
VLVQKILHLRMFIRSNKISEIVNDSDSDGGNFSDTCEVNSPFSSSSSSSNSKEEVIQPEPGRGKNTQGPS